MPPERPAPDPLELAHRLRILEEENARLTERQEEIALLGIVAEHIQGTEEPARILAAALERIALLRNLAFAAFCTLADGTATIVEACSASTDAPLSTRGLTLSAPVAAALARGSQLFAGERAWEAAFSGSAPLPIAPRAVLLVPSHARLWGPGCFVFCDDASAEGLRGARPLLEGVADAIVTRLDNVALLADLKALNAALDEKVRERTAQLVREIETRERTEESLRQAQKMESIGRLAGAIAHDFNNLLTSIIGTADFVNAQLPKDSPFAEDLVAIRDAGRHAADLTRQLLAFSRRQRLQVTVVALDRVVSDFAGMLSRLLGDAVTLRVELGAGDATVLADRSQLEQVLMNLAVNGRDAMPRGGTLTITTGLLAGAPGSPERAAGPRPGPWVRLSVADTGVGMAPEVAERAFEPFFTTKEGGKGTGLGLATVYGVVKQHQGEVTIHSAVGEGTRFDILLPRAARADVAADPVPGPRPRTASVRHERLLVVDDDPLVRAVVSRMLSGAGYEVLQAGSATEAVAQMAGAPIDALVTDVVMPGPQGGELAATFAARFPGRPVLFMSGYPGDAAALPKLTPPARHLAKPVTAAELVPAVEAMLAAARR